MPHNL